MNGYNEVFKTQNSNLKPQNVVILTSGTRGDVQPLVALGLRYASHGQTVRIVTQPAFRALVEQRGLGFAALAATPSDAFSIVGQDALVLGRNPLRTLVATMRYMQVARPLFAAMLESAWQQARQAQHLILTLPTMAWGLSLAEALGCPCTTVLLQPLGPTRAFPSPLLPFAHDLGPANRLSHSLTASLLWRPWRAHINHWRRGTLGLPALPASGPAMFNSLSNKLCYAYSPQVLPKPQDWPAHVHVSGYCFLDAPAGWQPPTETLRFLASGPPPVYVGFGSMGQRRPDLATLMVGALRTLGLRAVLALDQPLPDALCGQDMHSCDGLWHDWLFPQLAAVIHHGGAGTTGAVLRAGIPAVIAPIGVDQFFWARRIQELGVGCSAGPLRTLTHERLVAALRLALGERMRQESAEFATQLIADS